MKKRQKSNNTIHYILAAVAAVIVIAIIIMLIRWNKGTASEYDPTEDTSEFDYEANDYIQPLSTGDVDGKIKDGQLTILTLGNSPFADGGDNNNLAKALSKAYGATVVNGGIPDTYVAQQSAEATADYLYDYLSLYQVASALVTGDYSNLDKAAASLDDNTKAAVDRIKSVDMSTVDSIIIMYDLQDYIAHRPAVDESDAYTPTSVSGAIRAAAMLLREAYPYIRIVFLSTPACGQTIDNYYVDGDVIDLGNGKLTDYMGHEIAASAATGISFVDLYYGAINLDNRDMYLYDDYHINDEGAEVIADRVRTLIRLED